MRLLISPLLDAFKERRAVHQSIPSVSPTDVQRIVRREFRAEQFDAVMTVLGRYAASKQARECPRVQLAALKLAHGDLEPLRRQIATAERDYRDILAAAEYPEYMRAGMFGVRNLPREEQRRIVESDQHQYQDWLQKPGPSA